MTISPLILRVTRLLAAQDLDLPRYESTDAAGMDLIAAIPETAPLTVAPHARILVPTGLAFQIPEGFEGQVRPRSGLALRHGITVLNAPGTIDADYRGEVQVLLINLGQESFTFTRGMRIAQLVLAPVRQARIEQVEILETTARGAKGFGSTGV
jgi:dUTP pyrophosphatase